MKKILLLSLTVFFVVIASAQVQDANEQAARQLITKHSAAIGLTAKDLAAYRVSDSYQTAEGIRMIYLQQTYQGIPVFNQVQIVAFKNDKLLSNTGGRISTIEKLAGNKTTIPSLTPVQAVTRSLQDNGLATAKTITVLDQNDKGQYNFGRLDIAEEEITAQLQWLPLQDKTLKLVWQVLVVSSQSPDAWLTSVDAHTGEIADKINLTVFDHWGEAHASGLHSGEIETAYKPFNFVEQRPYEKAPAYSPFVVNSATYKVIKYPAESPQHPGGAPSDHVNPWTMAPGNATSLGWHFDGTEYHDSTRGNNVWAAEDRANTDDGNSAPNNNYGKAGLSTTAQPDLTFPYLYDFTKAPTDPTSDNQQAAIVNLFYWNNIVHDLTYLYGFDEPSGNFQVNNQGRGGVGSDAVKAQAQDGGGTNNANFLTLPDGIRGRMQMYLWTAPNPDRDGDLDNGIIVHEYGHGISNRLTGGPSQAACVANAEHGGEGWSDYYALMYTTDWATATITDGFTKPRGIGTYALGQAVTGSGIRTQRYCTDMSVNNKVYLSSLPTTPHNRGEIWCMALWEMTWEIIQAAGINPNLFNPSAGGGNAIALKLVTEGMRLQPCSPGFIDARNAILKADTLFFGAQYSCAIWKAFAKRGMGVNASQGSSQSASDQVPDYSVDNGTLSVVADVSQAEEQSNVIYTNTIVAGNCVPLTNITITDTLPANVTYVSGGTYNAANRTVKFGPVTLSNGQSMTFPFTVMVNDGTYFAPVTHLNEQVASSSIPSAWTITPVSGTIWTVTSSSSNSSPNSFFAPTSNTQQTDLRLATTESFTISPNTASNYTTLSFWHKYNTEEGWDGAVVEISTNNGSAWSDIGAANFIKNGYNGSLGTGSALAGRAAFTGLSGSSFIESVVNLSAYKGQSIKLRFRLATDNNTVASGTPGWWVDDIVLRSEPAVPIRSNLFNESNQRLSFADIVTKILPGNATPCTPITVSENPVSATECEGSNVSFSVIADAATSYQWQVNTGSGFVNITNTPPYSGAATATLTITGAGVSLSGNQYRVVLENDCAPLVTTQAATLTVFVPVAITGQPQDVAVCEGEDVLFAPVITGSAISYQWQVSVNGGSSYADVAGANGATFSVNNVAPGATGLLYRLVVTGACGPVTSAPALLTVNLYPQVSLTGLNPSVICISDEPVLLNAPIPGGVWNGQGVANGSFDPATVGIGPATVSYSVSAEGCTTNTSALIQVNECPERHVRLYQYPAVLIYPNPSDGMFNIRLNSDLYTSLGVMVYNSSGQLVYNRQFNNTRYGSVLPVDISRQPTGTYHIVVYSGNDKKAASLVVYR